MVEKLFNENIDNNDIKTVKRNQKGLFDRIINDDKIINQDKKEGGLFGNPPDNYKATKEKEEVVGIFSNLSDNYKTVSEKEKPRGLFNLLINKHDYFHDVNINGEGISNFYNEQARQIVVDKMIEKGFTQVYSKPTEPMTFYLDTLLCHDNNCPKLTYVIEYLGYSNNVKTKHSHNLDLHKT